MKTKDWKIWKRGEHFQAKASLKAGMPWRNTFEQGEEGIRQAEEVGLGNSLHPHQIVLQSATNILGFTYFIFSQCCRSAWEMRIRIQEGKNYPNK